MEMLKSKKGYALAVMFLVIFAIIVAATIVPELKQTILDFLRAFRGA